MPSENSEIPLHHSKQLLSLKPFFNCFRNESEKVRFFIYLCKHPILSEYHLDSKETKKTVSALRMLIILKSFFMTARVRVRIEITSKVL